MTQNKLAKYITASIILAGFLLVRFYEKKILDDGLFDFFENDYLTENLPPVSLSKLLLADSLHYGLNVLLSILFLKLIFKQKQLIGFLSLLFLLFYVLLIIFLFLAVIFYKPGHYLFLFYIRRLLIQPIFLFLLIPALFVQQKSKP